MIKRKHKMTNSEIFRQAAEAADNATLVQYGSNRPSTTNAAGDYWKLVYEATAAHLMKHVNGTY
jgi:uncharacterized protein with PhoU and TrkA domain